MINTTKTQEIHSQSAADDIMIAAKAAFETQKTEQGLIEEQKRIEAEKEEAEETEKTVQIFTAQFGFSPSGLVKYGRAVYLNQQISIWRQKNSEYHGGVISWFGNKECANREDGDDHPKIYQTSFDDLAGLGSFLDYVRDRNLCWSCQSTQNAENNVSAPPKALTTEEKLVNLLKDLIRENSPE